MLKHVTRSFHLFRSYASPSLVFCIVLDHFPPSPLIYNNHSHLRFCFFSLCYTLLALFNFVCMSFLHFFFDYLHVLLYAWILTYIYSLVINSCWFVGYKCAVLGCFRIGD